MENTNLNYLNIGIGDELSSSLIDDSLSVLTETEQIGDSILSQLHCQTEQIENSINEVNETRLDTRVARKILNLIKWRNIKEKCILIFIIIFLSIIDILLAYRILTNHGRIF
tara:strand:- start:260 stop:595 length:336 start_codon:yes stop_codon:yes gene_type:complete